MLAYKDCSFSTKIRAGIPRTKLYVILQTISELLLQDKIPGCIVVMVRDLVSFRYPSKNISQSDKTNNNRGFLKVLFHNKGMDMVNLSSLLHNKNVVSAVPTCMDNTPPIVNTNTIARKIFNHKNVVSDIDFFVGLSECTNSPYLYRPCCEQVTCTSYVIGRSYILKGPSYIPGTE